MKLLTKFVFCVAAAGAVAPAFAAWDPPPYHDDHGHHDDRDHHDDHRDWHDDHRDDHRGPPRHDWQRGHRYDGRVVVVDDWRTRRLREPPRGYHWVRDDDDGQFLLVAVATGIIADIALQH